jgi:ABC-type bacteriocin/lantibiotic exporter with double-glycine peptidase domain
VTQPAGDRTTHPAGERVTEPTGERTTQPTGDRTTQPTGDRTTHPAGDRTTEQSGAIRLDRIRKRFGPTVVLDDVSMTVAEGEFVALLGASGSGKTTLLRVIAGLEQPDAGRVWLGGRDVTGFGAGCSST